MEDYSAYVDPLDELRPILSESGALFWRELGFGLGCRVVGVTEGVKLLPHPLRALQSHLPLRLPLHVALRSAGRLLSSAAGRADSTRFERHFLPKDKNFPSIFPTPFSLVFSLGNIYN